MNKNAVTPESSKNSTPNKPPRTDKPNARKGGGGAGKHAKQGQQQNSSGKKSKNQQGSRDSKQGRRGPAVVNDDEDAGSKFSGSSFYSSPNAASLPRPPFRGGASPPHGNSTAIAQQPSGVQQQNGLPSTLGASMAGHPHPMATGAYAPPPAYPPMYPVQYQSPPGYPVMPYPNMPHMAHMHPQAWQQAPPHMMPMFAPMGPAGPMNSPLHPHPAAMAQPSQVQH